MLVRAAVNDDQWEQFERDHELDFALQHRGRLPVPGQPLQPARLLRRGVPGHPARHQAAGRARRARSRWPGSPTCPAAWCWSPARPVRARRPRWPSLLDLANRTRAGAHRHHRGPDRVPAPAQALPGQPARGRRRHRRPSRTALKHALRQDPDIILVGELRDLETTVDRAHRRRDRPPRARHAAHAERRADHRPHHRHLPAAPAAADPGPARGQRCRAWSPRRWRRAPTARAATSITEIMFATPAIRNLIREGKTTRSRRSCSPAAARACSRSTSTWPSGSSEQVITLRAGARALPLGRGAQAPRRTGVTPCRRPRRSTTSIVDTGGKRARARSRRPTRPRPRQLLRQQGVVPLSIYRGRHGPAARPQDPGPVGGRTTLKDLAVFSRQFATMTAVRHVAAALAGHPGGADRQRRR